MSQTIEKYLPKYNIEQSETALTLRIALPEVNKENISLKVEGVQLKLTAKRTVTENENWALISQREKPEQYSLKLKVKPEFDLQKVDAKFENNILQLTVPSASESTKEIEIF